MPKVQIRMDCFGLGSKQNDAQIGRALARKDFPILYDYNRWASARVLAAAAKRTEDSEFNGRDLMQSLKRSGLWTIFTAIMAISCSQGPPKDYAIKPVPVTQVRVEDDFWSRRIET